MWEWWWQEKLRREVEAVERLEDGEARLTDPALDAPLAPFGHLIAHEVGQVVGVRLALDLEQLTTTARRHTRSLQRKPDLLRSFLGHSPLSLRLR